MKQNSKEDLSAIFQRILLDIEKDTTWVQKFQFQPDVVKNSYLRFSKRVMSWVAHVKDAKNPHDSVKQFFVNHWSGYNKWRKSTHPPAALDSVPLKFDWSVIWKPKRLQPENYEPALQGLFLFYLVYNEIHDFRNLKNTFSLFYHVALLKWIHKEPVIIGQLYSHF
jgi:hypothetical protein